MPFICKCCQQPRLRADCPNFNPEQVRMGLEMKYRTGEINNVSLENIVNTFSSKDVKNLVSQYGYVKTMQKREAVIISVIKIITNSDAPETLENLEAISTLVIELGTFPISTTTNPTLVNDLQESTIRLIDYRTNLLTDIINQIPYSLPLKYLHPPAIHKLSTNAFRSFIHILRTIRDFGFVTINSLIGNRIIYTTKPRKISNKVKIVIKNQKNIPTNDTKTETETETKTEIEICPICISNIDKRVDMITNCGHFICTNCIGQFILKCDRKCVMCRGAVMNITTESEESFKKIKQQKELSRLLKFK